MKKLSLIITACAVSGAFELAAATNRYTGTNNNTQKIYSSIADTIPGKKQNNKRRTTKPDPSSPAPVNPDPNSPVPNNPSPTTPLPAPTPTPNPTPVPTPSPTPTPLPNSGTSPTTTPTTSTTH